MNKKRWLFGTAVVAFVAVMTVVMSGSSQSPEFAYLKGHKPEFDRRVMTSRGGYRWRAYVLNVPFDEAVKAVQRELTPQGFHMRLTYGSAQFKSDQDDRSISVERGRLMSSSTAIAGNRRIVSGVTVIEKADPSPRGWVTISTSRNYKGVSLLRERLRSKFVGDFNVSATAILSGKTAYMMVRPMPRESKGESISVHRGTAHLESEESVIYPHP